MSYVYYESFSSLHRPAGVYFSPVVVSELLFAMHAINEVADVQARSASLGPAALTTEGRCGDAGNRGQPARSVQAGSSGPIVWFRVTDKPQPEPRIPDVKPAGASRDFTICKKLAAPRTRQMPDSPARADGHRRLAVPAAPAVRRALIHASKVARHIAHAADDLAGVCQVGWHGTWRVQRGC